MSIGQGKSAKVVALETTTGKASATSGEVVEGSPLFGVAMLKIAMELKKQDGPPLDELISGVLARMDLPEDEFRAFLSANSGLLRTIASKRGY